MGNNATNQKKGIVTRGSGHIAESSGVSLPYFEKALTGQVCDDNHIETAKCAPAQAARRTFIEGYAVIHSASKIGIPHQGGPSRYDRPHSFAKNNPKAFKWFAEPDERSPDTKVEGNWVVRTFDKTKQDGNNGPGKFSPAKGKAEIVDESELLFQQCAVEKIKLECDDGRSTMGGELHVFIGDTVTVTAYRVNASETDPEKRLDVQCYITRYKQKNNPPAEETRHAAFVLTRNGRFVMPTLFWTEIKNKTLVGQNSQIPAGGGSKKMAKVSVLTLKEDWLLESDDEDGNLAGGPVGGSYDSYDMRRDGAALGRDLAPNAQKQRLEKKASKAQSAVTSARKKSKRGNGKPGAIGNAERNRNQANKTLGLHEWRTATHEARSEPNVKPNRALRGHARLILDSWKIVWEYFAFQPLRIDIAAHGCSPGASAVIKAFPKEELGAELAAIKDFPGRKVVDQIKSLVTTISDFWKGIKGANLRQFGPDPQLYRRSAYNIDLYFFRSKRSTTKGKEKSEEDLAPSIELKFAWKELTRDSNPGAGEIKGRKAWQVHKMWEVDVKLERLLGLVIQFEIDLNYCLGLGRFIADILSFFGVKTGIFLDINFGLSVGVGGTIGRDEYGKWELLSPNVPVKSVIQVSLIVKVGRFFEVGVRVTGRWEPKFGLGKNDKGQLCIKLTPTSFVIVLTFEAKVDILGWDLDTSYEMQRWPFKVPGRDLVIFGDGT